MSTGAGARYGRCCMVLEEPAEVLHGRREEGDSRRCGAGRAGCWWCPASRGWQDGGGGVRDRVVVGVSGAAGCWCGVRDGACVRGFAAVVRADPGSVGAAAGSAAGCIGGGVWVACGGRAGSVFGGVGGAESVGGGGRGTTACVCGR